MQKVSEIKIPWLTGALRLAISLWLVFAVGCMDGAPDEDENQNPDHTGNSNPPAPYSLACDTGEEITGCWQSESCVYVPPEKSRNGVEFWMQAVLPFRIEGERTAFVRHFAGSGCTGAPFAVYHNNLIDEYEVGESFTTREGLTAWVLAILSTGSNGIGFASFYLDGADRLCFGLNNYRFDVNGGGIHAKWSTTAAIDMEQHLKADYLKSMNLITDSLELENCLTRMPAGTVLTHAPAQ